MSNNHQVAQIRPVVLVTMPLHSGSGFASRAESNWQPISRTGIEVNSSLFPNAEFLDFDGDIEIAGRKVTLARLFRLDGQTAFVEVAVEADDIWSLTSNDIHKLYKAIYNFKIAHSGELFDWAKLSLGGSAEFSWTFTINLISGSRGKKELTALEPLIGPVTGFKDYSMMAVSSIDCVVMGETGAWVAMGERASDADVANAQFWVSRVQLAYSSIQFLLSDLMEQRRNILRTKKITPHAFDRFLTLKQQAVGLIFKIAPGSNASEWLDTQIYKVCYEAWQIDGEKQNLLEMLDRIEGVVANLEERRIRRNSFLVSLLINVITLTGLFAVLDYFVNFSGRQGLDMTMALSVERQAVFVVLALISLTALFFTVRNR